MLKYWSVRDPKDGTTISYYKYDGSSMWYRLPYGEWLPSGCNMCDIDKMWSVIDENAASMD